MAMTARANVAGGSTTQPLLLRCRRRRNGKEQGGHADDIGKKKKAQVLGVSLPTLVACHTCCFSRRFNLSTQCISRSPSILRSPTSRYMPRACGRWCGPPCGLPPSTPQYAAQRLRQSGICQGRVQAIPWARAPLLKFRDAASGLQCDVCVGSHAALCKSALLGQLAQLDWRVGALVRLVRSCPGSAGALEAVHC